MMILLYIFLLILFSFLLVLFFRRRSFSNKRKEAGRIAEADVALLLARLPSNRFRVYNDILLKDSSGHSVQIDHLVISLDGVFVIETKSHLGHIYGDEFGQYWWKYFSDKNGGVSRFAFYNPLLQNHSHLKFLSDNIPILNDIGVVSVVVFTRALSLDISAEPIFKHRFLFPDLRICRTLQPDKEVVKKWWYRFFGIKEVILDDWKIVLHSHQLLNVLTSAPEFLTFDEVDEITDAIESLMVCDSKNAISEHIRYVTRVSKEKDRLIRKGVCPRCGSFLTRIKGRYGYFYGCSDYPSCRFSCPEPNDS